MPGINLQLDGDNCWPELRGKIGTDAVIEANDLAIAFLPHGMTSGEPSLTLRIDLPDGRVVLTQTSLQIFTSAVRAFEARRAYLNDLAARGGTES